MCSPGHIPVTEANVSIITGKYYNQCALSSPVNQTPMAVMIATDKNSTRGALAILPNFITTLLF